MLTNGFLIGGLLVSGAMNWNFFAFGMTDQNGQGLLVPPSLSLTVVQPGKRYQADSRRDPFVPLNSARMQKPSKSEQLNAPIEESDNPKVLGIVLGREGFRAVLQLANGERIFVKPGSVLKHERARVIRISDDSVSLEYRLEENSGVRLIERRFSINHSDKAVGSPPG